MQLGAHRRVFSCLLNIIRDSVCQMGMERSFHQQGIMNKNVLESDFAPHCDGTMRQCSLTDLKLLKGM